MDPGKKWTSGNSPSYWAEWEGSQLRDREFLLFHVFSDEDRRRYVGGLASVLKPGGRLFLLCFSDEEPGDQGPRRVSRKEIEDAFAEGWVVERIEPSRYEVRPDPKDISFSNGGPKAWFVVVRRKW